MPKVSVIIPAYNCQDFISDTIESILNQTYKDYEIIVVDDGSTDRTVDILRRYSGKIRYIYESNGGPSKAKNTGILNATGEYIAFLDHDDAWLPDKLERQIPLLEKCKDIGIVYTDMYLLDNKSFADSAVQNNHFFHKARPHRGKVFRDLVLDNFIPTSSVVVRRECFEKNGMFDLLLPPAEDYNKWLHIAVDYEIDYIDEPLVKYRRHAGCFSNNPIIAMEKSIKALSEALNHYHLPTNLASNRLSFLHLRLGEAYLFRLDLLAARKNFLTALRFRYSFEALLFLIFTFIGRNNISVTKKILKLFQRQIEALRHTPQSLKA